jgi:hypothetical protein
MIQLLTCVSEPTQYKAVAKVRDSTLKCQDTIYYVVYTLNMYTA